jgi:hypothetical protein
MRHSASIVLPFSLLLLLPALAQNREAVLPAHQQFLQKLVVAAIERTYRPL